jgi:hypothetical protein
MAAPVLLDQDAIIGFGSGKMKSFCAGCFLSALGSFKRFHRVPGRLGLSRRNFTRNCHRQPLLNYLGIELVAVETYDQISRCAKRGAINLG